MEAIDLEACPCSGKNMSTLAAPWILLTLHDRDGAHGYEIRKRLLNHLEQLDMGFNLSGVYRHLNMLEKRGMLRSSWETRTPGPAKRRYFITDAGKACLWRWTGTLGAQAALIGKFMDEARRVFPRARLPRVSMGSGGTGK